MSTEMLEATRSTSLVHHEQSGFSALELLKEGQSGFSSSSKDIVLKTQMAQVTPNDSGVLYIDMTNPYGNGGVAQPGQYDRPDNGGVFRPEHKDPYGNGGVDRPEYDIVQPNKDDPYGNGGVARPEDDQKVRRGKDVLMGLGDDGGAGGAGQRAKHGTDTGSFDDALKTVEVNGLTDAQRDDAKSIGHAVMNGSQDDVRNILNKYQDDPEGMAHVVEALNNSFDGKGVTFKSANDGSTDLIVEAQALDNQAVAGVPKTTILTGNRASSSESEARDAANWKAIQMTIGSNMEHTSLEIPPLSGQPDSPPNQMASN